MSSTLDDTVCSEASIGVTLAVTGSSVAADSFDVVSITFDSDSLTVGGSNASTGRTVDSGVISERPCCRNLEVHPAGGPSRKFALVRRRLTGSPSRCRAG